MTMGCCGCTLAGAAITAVVLGLVESIYGLSWNILVIVLMSHEKTNITEDDIETTPTISTLSGVEYSDEYSAISENFSSKNLSLDDLWQKLTDNLQSDLAVEEHMFYIIVAALVLNSFWLITTLALAVGNAEKCRGMLKPWIGSTLIITVTDIAATVYFVFKAIKMDVPFEYSTMFFTNLFVFYAVMFSRGGIIIWIINIVLCVLVAQRTQEIKVGKNKRMPYSSDFNIMPYSLNPPYDTFETDSSARSKGYRPHTPPPDYEGPKGGGAKKRRPSLTSDTMTLPLSMPSSRASHQRPLSTSSYLYDDRVELQHRASCAAETVLHAYDNTAMEHEPWMGIPRPTLKNSHP